ncbi:MAG: (2Fe-2S)-binding protein [Defluviicoccus sp.]|nr:(2Fe-2S)-binding protein [Defluviicoccus sp.]MDE0275835.1 (2Fe-2S)-binding protein [Defluviicoccus sp.]
MIPVTLDINGREHRAEIDPRMLLVEFIRRRAGLTGTHVGCDTSQCGACTVHLDGIAVKSCTVFAAQAVGHAVTTIEGVSPEEGLSPLQAAFKEHHALQCGFCTPGMIMSALDMIRRGEAADEASVRAGLEGNLCRCTGYRNIVAAILAGAGAMAEG